jgi:hypothetical protein
LASLCLGLVPAQLFQTLMLFAPARMGGRSRLPWPRRLVILQRHKFFHQPCIAGLLSLSPIAGRERKGECLVSPQNGPSFSSNIRGRHGRCRACIYYRLRDVFTCHTHLSLLYVFCYTLILAQSSCAPNKTLLMGDDRISTNINLEGAT